jgi:hypothetical protein
MARESWAEVFYRRYGRYPPRADLERTLEEEFGIKPDTDGMYHRSRFEHLWKQLDDPN